MSTVAVLEKKPNHLPFDTSPPHTKTFLVQFWRSTACTGNTQSLVVMLDVSLWSMLAHVLRWSQVFEETRERSTRNNQTKECKESLLKDWYEMLNTLHHDLGIHTEVIPGEGPWRLSMCLLQAVMAHSRLLKHGGYTPFDEQQGCSITESMAERLARQQSAMKASPASNEHKTVAHVLFNTGPPGTRVCYWRADVPSMVSLPTIRQ